MDTFYDRWRELQAEAFGPCEPEYPGMDDDVALAIEYGIGSLEAYANSGTHYDDGVDWISDYDQGEAEQADWFFGLAWETLAEQQGLT